MSNKLFYSYKLLPYLPSPSPSPPLPDLDCIDEHSELETNCAWSDSARNCYSQTHHRTKRKKKQKLASFSDASDTDECSPYLFMDDTIKPNETETTSDFCTDFETEDEHEFERKEYDEPSISQSHKSITESTLSITSIHSRNLIDFQIDTILCDSLQQCPSMHRITDHLMRYQCIEEDRMDDIDFMIAVNETMIDDYHHIIIEHLSHKSIDEMNEEFNILHQRLKKCIHCNFHNCSSIQRYHRIRDETSTDNTQRLSLISSELQFYIDLMDTIHCYFIHSFDLGLRIRLNKYYDEKDDNDDDNQLNLDHEMKIIKRRLNGLNINRNRNNKFFTKFDGNNDELMCANNYSFGHRYYYWDEFKYNNDHDNGANKGYLKREWYITQKYDNLKHEILQNNVYKLDIYTLNTGIYKASKLLLCSLSKEIKSDSSIFNEYYKVSPNQSLWIDHILSVLLYCDYSALSYHLSSTFRRKCMNESNIELKKRNAEYWNWSKTLTETVQLFGDANESNTGYVDIYYHGVSYLLFDSFITHFCGPTSTTRMIGVAAAFAMSHNNGIILELVKENRYSSLKSLNCEWLSHFGNENEILFCGGQRPLKFHNIRVLAENEDYFWFIKALRLFHCVVDGKRLNEFEIECNEYDYEQYILPWDYTVIHQLMRRDACIPVYIDGLFVAFCENKKEIYIDIDIINSDYGGIKPYLFCEECPNLIEIDQLCVVFKHCEEIMISGIGNMCNVFMKELIGIINKLNHFKECNLEKIVLFNVTHNNMVLHDECMHRFDGFLDFPWQFQVDIKYRSDKIPETSHLVINRHINIEDEFVFNLLNESEQDDGTDSSVVYIDDEFVNGLYDHIQTIE